MRPRPHPGSKLSNRRKKRTMLRPYHNTDKRSSHRQTNKIEANKIIKITTRKTTIYTITSNNGGRIWATTPTGTKWLASSNRNKVINRRIAERGSTPTSPAWTWAVNLFGLKLTLQRMVPQSKPSRTRIFNSELDGTPTLSSCRLSSNYYEFVCCFYCDL